ncbi:MAG: zf-HC2 domain-containing protein [Planctomycetota bacterium]
MTCEWTNKLHAFHDGELAASECERVATHAAGCAVCALELDRLSRTARFLKAASIPAMRPMATLRFRERIAADNTARLARWLTAAAAAVILGCSTAMLSMQSAPAHSPRIVTAASTNDSLASIMLTVVPGNEFASAVESVDPLTLAVARDAASVRDDGRE